MYASVSSVNALLSGHKSAVNQALSHSAHMEEALQENFIKFVEELSFENTSIPDRLIETDCLSDDECAILRSKQDKDQVRCLLHKLMGRGPEKITTFLEILEQDNYERLTKCVYNSFERIKQENNNSKIECLVCHIKKYVDLRDISDYLFHKKMIKREIYGAILEPGTLHAQRGFLWSNILDGVNMAESTDCAIEHLKEALKGKYNYLIEHFNDNQFLKCLCHQTQRPLRRRRKHISEAGSQTDLSTTSDMSKFPLKQNFIHSETDSMSVSSSMDYGTSFANLKPFRTIRQARPCNPRTQDSAKLSFYPDQRTRHSSGKFDVVDQSNLVSDYNRQQSINYVEVYDDSIRPELQKNVNIISSTPVLPKTPTESEEILPDLHAESPTELDHIDIPQSAIYMYLDVNPELEMSKTEDDHDQSYETIYERTKFSLAQRSRKTSERSREDDSSCDDEDKVFSKRRQKISTRRKKHPKVVALTRSRTVSVPSKQYERKHHMKKKSLQRLERRERKLQQYESEEPYGPAASKSSRNPRQRKGPYNPTWFTHVQKPTTSNWDYNQARRHWLMSHRIADANRINTDTDMDQSYTEGSDTLGYDF